MAPLPPLTPASNAEVRAIVDEIVAEFDKDLATLSPADIEHMVLQEHRHPFEMTLDRLLEDELPR